MPNSLHDRAKPLFHRGLAFLVVSLLFISTRLSGQSNTRPRNLQPLHSIDAEYVTRHKTLEEQKPQRQRFDWRTLPRYKALQSRLDSLVSSNRLTALRQPADVIQRPSSNLVLTGVMDASAGAFTHCYDFCQYVGRVFVLHPTAPLAPTLPSGTALQYMGLRSYTTVLGSSDTIPEFRQVDLQRSYPVVWRAMEDVADFKPNAQEEDAIIGPFESRQEVQMATWLLEELRLQEWFVETKAQTTEQVEAGLVDMDAHEKPSDIQATDLCGDYSHGYLSATKPCEAVKQQSNWIRLCGAGQLDLYQCPPLHISPELMSTMHSAVNAFRGATGTLRDHLAAADAGMTAGIKQGAIAWGALGWYGDMSDYTHAWIQMNLQECRNSNYENAAYRTQGDLTAAEESEFFVAEIQCWATRYEVPPGSKTEGRVVEPLWWQEYLRDQKSTIFPRD